MTLNVLQIVEQRLRADGYDGLTHCDGDCACEISDLAPCGEILDTCEAGYRVPCECGDHDYHIATKRPAPKQTTDEGKESSGDYLEVERMKRITKSLEDLAGNARGVAFPETDDN